MILIINICKEPLHFYEFVKPVADIIRKFGKEALITHYKNLNKKEIEKADRIIICGTSLADNGFMENIEEFEWIKSCEKPIFGICGGAHIIGLILGFERKEEKKIGLGKIKIEKEFLRVEGEIESYFLHQFKVLPATFQKDNFYATLFHPEVKNKEMIENFAQL